MPRVGGVAVPGMQHKYRETALFFPSEGQYCQAFCTYCFRWAQFTAVGSDQAFQVRRNVHRFKDCSAGRSKCPFYELLNHADERNRWPMNAQKVLDPQFSHYVAPIPIFSNWSLKACTHTPIFGGSVLESVDSEL